MSPALTSARRVGDGEPRAAGQVVDRRDIGRIDPVRSEPDRLDDRHPRGEYRGRGDPDRERRPPGQPRWRGPAISNRNSTTGNRRSTPEPDSIWLGSTKYAANRTAMAAPTRGAISRRFFQASPASSATKHAKHAMSNGRL